MTERRHGPSDEQFIALQNRLSELADEGAVGLLSKMDVALISYALGYATGGAALGIPSPRAPKSESAEDGPLPIDHRALVTSVRVATEDSRRAFLSVIVRGELAGTLVVDPEDARPLQLLLALVGAGKRCIPIENIPWLVKDFAVLYGVTERLVLDIDAEKEVDLGHLKAQLARLLPAYEACQAARRMVSKGD